ncbi:MAG: M48 family metallopeptidase [Lamprobacter sp.]|uniref:M48 family metallopeptidase n=1 Tax=Lamprobacter sp. TaxID=3100796 RepID=UPI002B260507|nr:M48 family metallopeptidase [Lamprobacter sp.]MEA3641933.1 M48 family metallopeptidase [Lamprobacter sp.]
MIESTTRDMRTGGLGLRPLTLLLMTCIFSLTLLSCATAPETGRRQLLLVSPVEEAQLGLQAFQQIKQQQPLVTRGKEAAMLQQVGGRISQVAPLPNARWEFVLFKDESPNAFALPGGKVGVNTGILPITKDEAGLATVIGHEVAHAVARHGAERMSHDLLVQLGGAGLSAALGNEAGASRDLIMQAYGIGSQLGVMLPYSRTQELEADELGLLYMARAGYDPREAIGFWQRFAAYNAKRGGAPAEFLSTHPLDQRRIAALEQAMPRAVAEYERARVR